MNEGVARTILRSQLQSTAPNVEIVQSLCRDILGCIPDELRYQVWQLVLGVDAREGFSVEEELKCISEDMDNQRVIRVDAARTRADMKYFQLKETQSIVSKLLTMYCKQHSISYKQGLNEVLAPFLLLKGAPSKVPLGSCYSTFNAFVQRYLPQMYADVNFVGLQSEFRLFRLLLQYHDPELSVYLDQHLLSPELYATPWFLTHFARNVPIELLLKLWDTILLIKNRNVSQMFHIFVAIAFLCSNRSTLFRAHSSDLPILLAGSLASNSRSPDTQENQPKQHSSSQRNASVPQNNSMHVLLSELRGLHSMEMMIEVAKKACALFDMTPRSFDDLVNSALYSTISPASCTLEELEQLYCLPSSPSDFLRAADDDLHAVPIAVEDIEALETSSVVADNGIDCGTDSDSSIIDEPSESKSQATEVTRSSENKQLLQSLASQTRKRLRKLKLMNSGTIIIDCRPRKAYVNERLESPMIHHVDPVLLDTPDNLGFVLIQIATFGGETWECNSLDVCGWERYKSLCPHRASWPQHDDGLFNPWAQPLHWHTTVVGDMDDPTNAEFARAVVEQMVRLGCKRVSIAKGGWQSVLKEFHSLKGELRMQLKTGGIPPPAIPLPGESDIVSSNPTQQTTSDSQESSWIQRLGQSIRGTPVEDGSVQNNNDTKQIPQQAADEDTNKTSNDTKRTTYFGSIFRRTNSQRSSESSASITEAANETSNSALNDQHPTNQMAKLAKQGWEPYQPVRKRFGFKMEFYCDLVLDSGEKVPCILGLSQTSVVRACINPNQPDTVRVDSCNPMTNVAKITSRKSRKNLVVFHFTDDTNQQQVRREAYLFYKGRSRECIEYVKMQYAALAPQGTATSRMR